MLSHHGRRWLVWNGPGDRQLDFAALLAVSGWRFQPAVEGGVALATWVEVPVSFTLDRR